MYFTKWMYMYAASDETIYFDKSLSYIYIHTPIQELCNGVVMNKMYEAVRSNTCSKKMGNIYSHCLTNIQHH